MSSTAENPMRPSEEGLLTPEVAGQESKDSRFLKRVGDRGIELVDAWNQHGLENGRFWQRILLAFLMLAGFNLAIMPLHHDVAWHLFAAARILDGAQLYVDLLEYNPPLIYYLNVPIAFLAGLISVPSNIVLLVFLFLLILGSCWLSGYLMEIAIPDSSLTLRRVLKLGMLFGTLVFTGSNFGQREHIIVVLLLPYMLLIAARLQGWRPPTGLALGIGVAGAVAASLKPQFVLLWICFEAYYWYRNQYRIGSLIRTETLATGIGGLSYIGVVLVFFPQYLPLIQVAREVYGTYSTDLWKSIFRSVGLPLFAMSLFYVLPTPRPVRSLRALLAIAVCNTWLFAFVSLKAWRYHFYPPRFFAVLLFVLILVTLADGPFRLDRLRKSYRSLAAAIVVLMLFWQVSGNLRFNSSVHAGWKFSDQGVITRLLREEPVGTPVMFLSSSIFPTFPVLNFTEVSFAQRMPFLWPLPTFYSEGQSMRDPKEMAPAERFALETVIEDLMSSKPRIVIVDERVQKQGFEENAFDYLAYYGQDKRFRTEWENYQLSSFAGAYKIYRRQPEP